MGSVRAEIPETIKGFSSMHLASMREGAIDRKHKELMALAIGISLGCEGCIAYHMHEALHAGADDDEVLETIGVSVMMGGGPAYVYSGEALSALRQFRAQP